MRKQQWEKPKIIELVKGLPEETLLSNCRTMGRGNAYNNVAGTCFFWGTYSWGTQCYGCQEGSGS